jgi:hypothetical protein
VCKWTWRPNWPLWYCYCGRGGVSAHIRANMPLAHQRRGDLYCLTDRENAAKIVWHVPARCWWMPLGRPNHAARFCLERERGIRSRQQHGCSQQIGPCDNVGANRRKYHSIIVSNNWPVGARVGRRKHQCKTHPPGLPANRHSCLLSVSFINNNNNNKYAYAGTNDCFTYLRVL